MALSKGPEQEEIKNENKKSEQGIARNPLLAFFDPKGNPLNASIGSSPVHSHSESKMSGTKPGEHFHSGSEMNKIGAGDRGIKVIQPRVREIRRVKVEFVCDEGVSCQRSGWEEFRVFSVPLFVPSLKITVI